ncbi:MAG: adenine deaminase, partial [Methanobacteriota archaeon]
MLREYRKDISAMRRVIRTALNEAIPDLVLKDCNLVDVYSGEILKTDISIAAGRIASIDKCPITPKKVLRCNQYYAVSGLIDGHVHIDSTLLTPTQLAKILLPHGTTTVLIDPMEIANVLGMKG